MAGYLIRSLKKRPEVILKLALSSDGKIGRLGDGQVAITGDIVASAGASDAGRSRRDPGRHRHGAGGRSGTDGPAAGTGEPFAGAHRARPRAQAAAGLEAGAVGAAACRCCIAASRRSRPAPPGGAGDAPARGFWPPKPLTAASRCRNCSRISPRRACPASSSRAAPRPRGISSTRGWWTASCSFTGRSTIGEGGIAAPVDRDHDTGGFPPAARGAVRRRRYSRMDQGRSDVYRNCHRCRHGRGADAAAGGRPAADRDRLRSGRPSPSARRSPAAASA